MTEALGIPAESVEIATNEYVVNPVDHLGLVRTIAGKFTPIGMEVEDTEQYADGVIGLLRACKTYDPSQGLFSTVAWKSINTAIIQGWRKKGRKKRQGIVVSLEEKQADPLDVRPDLSNIGHVIARFLEPHPDDSERNLRCKEVLRQHFIDEKTWQEIGDEMGVSKTRAQQLGNAGLDLIRTRFKIADFNTVEELLEDRF